MCFLAEQQNFQLSSAEELLSFYQEAFPCLFSWKCLWRIAHCISYKHLLHGCWCRGPLQRMSSSHCLSLSWELDPGLYEWETFTGRLPVPACCVHKAGVILTCGEAGMCWKPKFTMVKCWPMNWQNSCQARCPGKLYLGSGEFCVVILFGCQLLAIWHPGSTLVGKIFRNNK